MHMSDFQSILSFIMKKVQNRLQLAAAVVFLLIASFVTVSLLNYYSMRDAVREEIISSSLPLVREHIYLNIGTQLGEPLLTSQLMAGDTFLIDWIESGEETIDSITAYLSAIRAEHGYSSTFFVSAATGNYYSYEGLHKTLSPQDEHDSWYYGFAQSPRDIVFDVDTDEVLGGRLTVFINIKVYDSNGGFLGVTGVGIDMHSLSGLLSDTQQTYGREIFLIDAEGTIQVHSDPDRILKSSIRDIDGMGPIAAQLLSSKTDIQSEEFSGRHSTILMTARYLPMIDWFIVVQHDLNSSLQIARNNLYRSLLTGVSVSIIIFLLLLRITHSYQKQLEDLSTIDHLTGINNRFSCERLLSYEMRRSERYGYEVAVLLLDIDDFKQINDTHGHGVGDSVLRHFTTLLSASLRDADHLGRWGGDEFLIIVPHCTLEQARQVAEKCLQRTRAELFSNRLSITTSIGYTTVAPEDTISSVLQRADSGLYLSKQQGKDRSTAFPVPSGGTP